MIDNDSNTNALSGRFSLGLALVILSCGLLAVRTDGAPQVVVRLLQVGLALAGAYLLGRERWGSRAS